MNWFPDKSDSPYQILMSDGTTRPGIKWGKFRTYNEGTWIERRRYDLFFTLPLYLYHEPVRKIRRFFKPKDKENECRRPNP